MEFKGYAWRHEELRKRSRRYKIIDTLLLIVWFIGLLFGAGGMLVFCLTGNWELPLMMFAVTAALWFIRTVFDHGTIDF